MNVLVGWGSNADDELGPPATDVVAEPRVLRVLPHHIEPTCYATRSCQTTIVGNDTLYTSSRGTIQKISIPRSVISVAVGRDFTVLLTATGEVWTYGGGAYGQLGHGRTMYEASKPRRVEALRNAKIIHVVAADFHWLAIDSLGFTYGCGRNSTAQLGLGHMENVYTPTAITALWPHPVVHADTGDCHSAVLTANGSVLCFGCNKYGQIGRGMQQIVRTTAMYPELVALPLSRNRNAETCLKFAHIACGSHHTMALRSDGSIACWGNGTNGQLGSRTAQHKFSPNIVHVNACFVAVAAGGCHSAGITETGEMFSWGDGAHGQVGDGEMSDKFLPVRVSLRKLHSSSSLRAIPRFLSVKCGDFHKVGVVSYDTNAQHADFFQSRIDRIPMCHVDQIMFPKSGLSRFGCAQVLLRSFVKNSAPHFPAVLQDMIESYASFMATFGEEGVEILTKSAAKIRHEAQIAFGIVEEGGYLFGYQDYSKQVDRPLQTQTTNDTTCCRETVVNVRESGLLLCLAHLNPIYCMGKRKLELTELAHLILLLRGPAQEAFINAMSHCPAEVLVKQCIRPFQQILTHELSIKQFVTRNAIMATKCLALLYHAVWRASNQAELDRLLIPQREFYNVTVSERVNLAVDYNRWSQKYHLEKLPPIDVDEKHETFSFCTYSFILNEDAKFRILALESRASMTSGRETRAASGLFFGTDEIDPTTPNLILHVRRYSIVTDTFDILSRYIVSDPSDLHKPIKVKFKGEDGIDEGGVRKEFFQVLLDSLLSPDYGMFTCNEQTRSCWFRVDCLEPTQSWSIVGMIFGLAAFNSILLDIQFPLLVYKKLTGVFENKLRAITENQSFDFSSSYSPTLGDLKETFPDIGNSLQKLLDYEGEDIEEIFGLTHEISYEGIFGQYKTVNLIENGWKVPVTKANRNEFVNLYVRYLLQDSIKAQFSNFAKGFCFMLQGPFVTRISPTELETLLIGEQLLEFNALRHATRYEGFTENSAVIKYLWCVLMEFNEKEKALFLAFVTGSGRAPVGGLQNLKMVVQNSGKDSTALPTSHTCFNVLLLPEYLTRAKLRDRLVTAINNSQGFGLR